MLRVDRRHLLRMLGAGALAAGLSPYSTPASFAADSSFLRIGVAVFPQSLNPLSVRDLVARQMLGSMYESLTTIGPDGSIAPGLAIRWEASEDTRRWRLTLREGVRFHTGKLFTAEDVKKSFEASGRGMTTGGFAVLGLSKIKGFNDLAAGRSGDLQGVQVIDNHTVEIVCDHPTAIFPYLRFNIVDVDYVKANGPDWYMKGSAGTGPYRLVSAIGGTRLDVEENKSWWNGKSLFRKIAILATGGENQAISMYNNGEIDFYLVDTGTFNLVVDEIGFKRDLVSCERMQSRTVALNPQKYPAFRDVRVRHALAHAIDHEAVAERFFRGWGKVHRGVVPPSILSDDGLPDRAYDPTLAADLLAQAGFARGEGMDPLTVYVIPEFRREFAYYVSQWRNLGIPVSLETSGRQVYLEKSRAGEYQAYFLGWTATYPDPMVFLEEKFFSGSKFNQLKWKSDAFDSLIAQAMAIADPIGRQPLYRKAERIVMEDLPVIPLVVPDYLALRSNPLADRFMTSFGGISII